MQAKVLRFDWDNVNQWEVDDESMAFAFVFTKPDQKTRRIRIYTPYVGFPLPSPTVHTNL